MHATVYSNKSIVKFAENFIAIEIDKSTEEGEKESKQYTTTSCPEVIFYTYEGIEVCRAPGLVKASDFLKKMREAHEANKKALKAAEKKEKEEEKKNEDEDGDKEKAKEDDGGDEEE